jgi:hypothetical protein
VTARMTAAEIAAELRAALGWQGWVPELTGQPGLPDGVSADLTVFHRALSAHAAADCASPSASRQLQLAADEVAAAQALPADDPDAYRHLGMALAYTVQARQASSRGFA